MIGRRRKPEMTTAQLLRVIQTDWERTAVETPVEPLICPRCGQAVAYYCSCGQAG